MYENKKREEMVKIGNLENERCNSEVEVISAPSSIRIPTVNLTNMYTAEN